MDRFYQYIKDVKTHKIITNKYIPLAIKRFEDDIKKSKSSDYPYKFDEEKANNFIRFTEALKLYKDKWKGLPLHLQPWQVFALGNIYGWVYKDTGLRRFRKALIFVGRKNGKSTMVSSCLLYDVLTTAGGEAYCAATKRAQSQIVLNSAKEMVKQNPGLSKRLTYYRSVSRIVNESNVSKIEALSADYSSFDGLNPSCVVIDEVSAMKDYNIIKVLQSGQYSRAEPLMIEITSGSDDIYSAGSLEFERASKILQGTLEDDSFFTVLYCLDEKDDWRNEKTYIKANPNLGVSVFQDALIKAKNEAIQQPSLEGEFRIKNLGQFVSPISAWIPYQTWNKSVVNGDTISFPTDLSKCISVAAVDLSERYDFTAYSIYFYFPELNKYFVKHHIYFPEEQIENKMKHDSPMIRKWVEQNYITATTGSIINYTVMFNDLKEDIEKYHIKEVAYDPYNSSTLITEMEPYCDLVEVLQSMKNISPMAKDWEASVINGEIVDNNPVMKWMVSCASVYKDSNGNIKPIKEKGSNGNRIDAVITSLMAHGRCKALAENIDFRTPEQIQAEMEKALSALPEIG